MSNYLYIAMSGIVINLADKARRARARGECATAGDYADVAVGTVTHVSSRTLEDLAADMELPVGVVRALSEGEDPFIAALDAGWDVAEASGLLDSLGLK